MFYKDLTSSAVTHSHILFDISEFPYPDPSAPNLLDNFLLLAMLQKAEFKIDIFNTDYSDSRTDMHGWRGTANIASITSTPIPGTFWLVGSALFVLMGIKRKGYAGIVCCTAIE